MRSPSTTRAHKVISLLIKALILTFSFFYIAYRLTGSDLHNLSASLKNADPGLLLIAFVLLFLNWGLEALKWQILIAPLERISLLTSLKSVFAGVTVSIFMPNRIGEFAGRIFFLEKADKVQATLKNFIGAALQFLVTLLAGLLASWIFVKQQRTAIFSENISLAVILLFVLMFIVIVTLIVMNRYRQRFSARVRSYSDALTSVSPQLLTGIFLLSALRYCVFLFQYYLVLIALGVHAGFFVSLLLIAITFLVTSALPSFALTEVVTRGAVASGFFAFVIPDTAGVVAASLLVWIINLAIPALIGSIFTWQLKFFNK